MFSHGRGKLDSDLIVFVNSRIGFKVDRSIEFFLGLLGDRDGQRNQLNAFLLNFARVILFELYHTIYNNSRVVTNTLATSLLNITLSC